MEGQAQVDVELEREGPLKTFYRLIAHPASEFERLNGKSDATLPLVFITLIGIIGLANEMVLLSKVSIAELPPFGFSGPPMVESLIAQLPALIYLYYFFESILFPSFEAIFNFAAVWVVLWLAGKSWSVHGEQIAVLLLVFVAGTPLDHRHGIFDHNAVAAEHRDHRRGNVGNLHVPAQQKRVLRSLGILGLDRRNLGGRAHRPVGESYAQFIRASGSRPCHGYTGNNDAPYILPLLKSMLKAHDKGKTLRFTRYT